MKVVINNDFGGFGLSHKATLRYAELKGIEIYSFKDKEGFGSGLVPYEEGEGKEPYLIYYYTTPDRQDHTFFSDRDIPRNDPHLVQVVEELGLEADGSHADLKVVEIPDDVDWQIEEYDGSEWVSEVHRTWK